MSSLRKIWQRIRSITLRQWAFGTLTVVVGFVVLMGVLYAWDYTNSSTFCGTTCHTMPPEYNAWQRSPHARVNCVECHIGRDFIATSFTRKAGDLKHVLTMSTGNFTYPIYADSMLPASDACEKCHWPEKFANDRSEIIKHYQTDEKNTLITTYLLMKIGGGTQRQGQGYGIHWHIENKVEFIATDELKQNIPWVRVTDANGQVTVYQDVQNPLTPDQINKAAKHVMDCIDCHNRVSHTFESPDQALDDGLALNRIDASIPAIKKKSLDVLSGTYKSFDDANKVIDSLDGYYLQNYPDYYKANTAKIKSAIDYLKTLYQSLVYPDQSLSWTTHPDNLGHKDSAGCFRCHDGKHLTADNQAIPLECNLCHSLPEVSKPGSPAPAISLQSAQDEPASHLSSTWIYEHRTAFDTSCQACHDTNNAGGTDNSSFCSNSACHGTNWKFVGLNAPALTKALKPTSTVTSTAASTTPPVIPHPIGGNPDCQRCHGLTSTVRPFPADHAGRTNDVCLACHKPTVLPTPVPNPQASNAGGPPTIPHDLAGRSQCLGCHSNTTSGAPQIPQFHKDYGFTNNNCLTCHKSSVVVPTATAAGAPTATPASTAGGPPNIPADHAGRTGCLQCHVQGLLGAPKYPADHAGRTEDMCKLCHKGP